MKEINTFIKSNRNTDIPVTIVDCQIANAALIIFVHGFKADRHEGGRFSDVATELAKLGYSSIRMGFPGCDESKEDFINYSLTNNLNDIETCYKYMLDSYSIDNNRIGMIGYSMGARLTSIFANKHQELKTIGLWAGACFKDYGGDNFLGCDLKNIKEEINIKGYCDYLNTFDNDIIKLSKQLIDDMISYNPIECLNSFKGNAIIVHGNKDITVDVNVGYDNFYALKNAKNKKLVIIDDANHGFGLWDNKMHQSKQLVEETILFFKNNL
ncbi:MAG: alpha/beta hydrolase [Erysipelotrichaceae bacterium]|nr:alpha/beta hydrolase [Erysipelotrichaceae bacterium]